MGFNTKLIHGNRKNDIQTGATNTPIYFSNSYNHETAKELEDIFVGRDLGYVYSRISNPTVEAFEKRLALIEEGISAVAVASGMSAVYLAIMNILIPGDEMISSAGVFGGTYNLLKNIKRYGISVKFLSELNKDVILEAITPKTKVIFVETIGNPKLDIPDFEEISAICIEKSIIFIVDSTVTSPYLFKPIKYGADIVIHSTSKYINGTANSIGGVIVDGGSEKFSDDKFIDFKSYNKRFGRFAFSAKLRNEIGKDLGAVMSPMNSFLNLIGLETLGLRMRVHCDNARTLAEHLENHSQVESVNYPDLGTSKYNLLARKYFPKGASGIITLRVGSKERAFKLIDSLKMVSNLANIGDTKSLILHPASTICCNNTLEEKEHMGVYEDLIRVSVGIEDSEDIIEDFENAFKRT